jgi:hypothetical protein
VKRPTRPVDEADWKRHLEVAQADRAADDGRGARAGVAAVSWRPALPWWAVIVRLVVVIVEIIVWTLIVGWRWLIELNTGRTCNPTPRGCGPDPTIFVIWWLIGVAAVLAVGWLWGFSERDRGTAEFAERRSRAAAMPGRLLIGAFLGMAFGLVLGVYAAHAVERLPLLRDHRGASWDALLRLGRPAHRVRIVGAARVSGRRNARPMTAEELERVLRRYPGDR